MLPFLPAIIFGAYFDMLRSSFANALALPKTDAPAVIVSEED